MTSEAFEGGGDGGGGGDEAAAFLCPLLRLGSVFVVVFGIAVLLSSLPLICTINSSKRDTVQFASSSACDDEGGGVNGRDGRRKPRNMC